MPPETGGEDVHFNWILQKDVQILLQVYNFKFLFLGLVQDVNTPNTVRPFKIADKNIWLLDFQ